MDISRITEINPRLAWKNEAIDFTPWLAENIDQLSETLGIELELVDTEVSVTSYSADILATDLGTGHRVLIENQLEKSDHGHLGQIMTYLAGLDARVVVWIAPQFSAAHLSALKWLNEHTPNDFAFFAVGLRVVRIGDSPAAPLFEIKAQPDIWARDVSRKASDAESERSILRERFWQLYLSKNPGRFKATRSSNVWIPLNSDGSLVLSMYMGENSSGLFLRGAHGADRAILESYVDANGEVLSERLGVPVAMNQRLGMCFVDQIEINLREENRWPEAINWLENRSLDYQAAVNDLPEP